MNESILDFPNESLSPEIWEKDENGIYILKTEVSIVIQKIVDWVQSRFNIPEMGVDIPGSITSNSYSKNSDIDIHFTSPKMKKGKSDDFNKLLRSEFKNVFLKQNPDCVEVNGFPLELYFQENPFQDLMSVGCYDFLGKRWLVGPELQDLSFDPYAEYFVKDMKHVDIIINDVREVILASYENSVVLSKSRDQKFKEQQWNRLKKCIKAGKTIFDKLRATRKHKSNPKNLKQALKGRVDKNWKIADSAFKLLNKFGYIAVLKQLAVFQEQINNKEFVDPEEVSKTIVDSLTNNISNKKLVDSEYINFQKRLKNIDEKELDESFASYASTLAMSLALAFPGILSAKTLNYAMNMNKNSIQYQQRKDYFDNALASINLKQTFNGYTFQQAINIVAATFFGEGRSEIKNSGLDKIIDTIVNRSGNNISKIPEICISKRPGATAYQYSFWNANVGSLSKIKNQQIVIPASIKNNILERNAWNVCLKKAIQVMTGKYVVTNDIINSYYVTNMKNPPSWAKKLTNVIKVGKHTFGYLKDHDSNIFDMVTFRRIKHDNISSPVYIVKTGDTISQIAKNTNKTIAQLKKLNPNITDINKIRIGQKINV